MYRVPIDGLMVEYMALRLIGLPRIQIRTFIQIHIFKFGITFYKINVH